MRKASFIFMGLLMLSGCKPPPVDLFNVETYLRPYERELDKPLTIILDPEIPNDFAVDGAGLREMEVYDFRRSLQLSLYYTFVNTYQDVYFSDQIDTSSITLHIYRIRPSWVIKSTSTSVTGTDVVVSSTSYEVASLIRYDGVVYQNGKKTSVIDNEVESEKTASIKRKWGDTFKDAVREMCEDLYKTLVSAETNTDKASGN